ncbi:hypothetical protein B9Z55_026892 [Caenorhabditis nigoni]|uniref:F-box domain-containing protein n=1 Tax=Caenorhabditis nigoni TaxID=1611254 RepID=A0A2G5SHW7_9PELO|nr:hypothetical protein B9Z55_026892 [Caenorhabditis nigoni]
MPLISLTDPSTIRHFILHDVLLKTPIFEGYKTLCGIIGDENIDFPEYEFWYYRFYDGNFDLEDDRSSLPQPKTFMNLPIHVIREIPVHLDLKNRMNVRKVSKSLRDFIDSQKINFSEFYVNISKNSIHMRIEKDSFYYSEFPVEIPSQAVTIINKDFQKMASKDLENVLKIVRKIKILIVTVDECCSKIHFDSVVGKFRNFKYDVSDCRLHFLNTEDLTEFLSSMKPGKLEKLALSTTEGNGNSNELVEMDQFKMAKAVDIERFGILDPSLIDRFFGFAEFTVQLEDIRREDVISFRKALEKLPKNGEWNFHSTQLIREEVELAIDHLMVTNHNFSGGIRDGILWDFENYHGKPNSRNLGKIDNWKLCILSDVLAGKAIEKSYKDVAETFGAENIDFLDMELWFYRFYKGDYDLDYDRTLDGKHLEFSNLPMIIHQQIIDNLDSENHLTLRRISKSLRNMVDQGKPAIKHLSIEYKLHYIRVKIDNFSACYWKYLDVDYRKIALNHVLILLKNPKLRLRSLHVWSPCSLDPFFIDFFNNLKHKISTKYLELNVDCPEATSLFLTCMKPKFLEEVILMKGSIAEIVKFDQWKSLKNALCSPIVSGQIDHFLGFTKCVITVPDLTEEHLMKLREELSKSQIFESCHIFLGNFEVPYELIMSVFEPISGLEYVYDEDDMPQFVYSYVIPNSRNFLNWTISVGDLKILMHRSSQFFASFSVDFSVFVVFFLLTINKNWTKNFLENEKNSIENRETVQIGKK